MAMIFQFFSVRSAHDDTQIHKMDNIIDKISDRKLVVRRRRKKKRHPYTESGKDFPHYSGNNHRYFFQNHIQPYKDFLDVPAVDDYDEIDFYEDKNYEYIDQEDMETIKLNFETSK